MPADSSSRMICSRIARVRSSPGLGVDHLELDVVEDHLLHVGERDVPAVRRVVEPAVRVFLDDARGIAHGALRGRRGGHYNRLIYWVFGIRIPAVGKILVRCTKKFLTFGVAASLQFVLCGAAIAAVGRVRTSLPDRRVAGTAGSWRQGSRRSDRINSRRKRTHHVQRHEQFADFNKVNVAQATKLAAIAMENAEKLVQAQHRTTAKVALAQGVEGATAVASVKDVQDLIALPTKYAETGVESVVGYTRSLYEISSQAQAQFTALAEEAWPTTRRTSPSWVEKASKSAPAGSEVAINAFKSTVAATDRRVRPVPEGVEAGREPGRRERPRRGRQRDEGRRRAEGPQGCVTQPHHRGSRAGRVENSADRSPSLRIVSTCIFFLLLKDTASAPQGNLRGFFLRRV